MTGMRSIVMSVCFSGVVIADDSYQYDFNIKRTSISDITSQSIDTNASLIYYLYPVVYGNYPLAEASFIDRHSSVRVLAGSTFLSFSSDNISTKSFYGSVKYSENNFPVTLSFFSLKQDSNGSINTIDIDSSGSINGVEGGLYLTRSTYGSITYKKTKSNSTANGFSYYSIDKVIYQSDLKHLQILHNNQYVSLYMYAKKEERQSQDDIFETSEKYNSYEAGASLTYYFNKSLGFSVGATKVVTRNSDRDEGREFYFSFSRYYTPQTNMNFEVFQYKSDVGNNDDDYDGVSFGLLHRF